MKSIRTTKKDETEEFVAFWNLWKPFARHTDGRGDARDTFYQHVNAGAPAQDIVDGARCFLRTMKDKDRDYIPLAASWINKRAYEDLAEAQRAFDARMAEAQQRRVDAAVNVVDLPASQQISPERRAEMVARMRNEMRRAGA